MEKINKKIYFSKVIFGIVFLGLVGFIIYNLFLMYSKIDVTNDYRYTAERTSLSTDSSQTVDNVIEKNKTVADMLENLTESVVGISKLNDVGVSILNNVSSDELGLGTGIIVSDNGYILSNSHVTGEKFSSCYVTIDEKQYKGSVVWSDPNLDLSITKVRVNNLKFVTFGDSNKIRIGESVFAIGNPIGFEFRKTVTSGIISALNRTIRIAENNDENYISSLIQTDATINPGNSGGPLVNSTGEVIGINTVKISSAEGIGFAIPINVIKPVVESFKRNDSFDEATLGIYAYDGNIAKYLDSKNNDINGIYISRIILNGPAFNTNLKEGDIIKEIDGKRINTINDLRSYIYTKVPGEEVVLSITRNEKELEVKIVLGRK